MKVALFGGSFNPIHNAHIQIMEKILNKNLVDEIWIVPCGHHAFDKELEDENKRIEMIGLAVQNNPKIKIDKTETESKEKNYTVATLRKLREKYSYEFFLIIGSDILYELEKWYESKKLIEREKFIVFPRKGFPIINKLGLNMKIINNNPLSISSTEIRKKIKQGEPFHHLVPLTTVDYIKQEKLYRGKF